MTAALAAALRAAAAGVLPGEAGTSLLIDSGHFLHRADFTPFIRAAAAAGDGTPMAWTDWEPSPPPSTPGSCPPAAARKPSCASPPASPPDCPVSLRDTVTSLDHANLTRTLTAIRHAAGHP